MNEENNDCSICFEEFAEDHSKITLRCGHSFGFSCIRQWFDQNPRAGCPLCRKFISKEDLRGDWFILELRKFTGDMIPVSAHAMMSVKELKLVYQAYDKIPPDDVRLIFASRQLQDDFCLHHYNLRDNAPIHVVLKIRGD